MTSYTASLGWQSDGNFQSGTYSRVHELRFDGGAVVRGSSSPHSVRIPWSDPAGVDPEEMLVAAASACHMLWFLFLAQREGLDVLRYTDDAVGTMGADQNGRAFIDRITLRPRIAFGGAAPAGDLLDRLHHAAHDKCYIANSLRAEVVVEPVD